VGHGGPAVTLLANPQPANPTGTPRTGCWFVDSGATTVTPGGVVHEQFLILAAVLGIAGVAGLLAIRLRQPLITAFIAVGILVGPVGLNWVQPGDDVALLAEVGIAILLFLVGLKLDLRLIRVSGPVALATGLGQVMFTSLGGFGLAVLLGFDTVTALYIAVALTFSSTIIIVKLLSDKQELETQHGRIAIGFLIVQDIVVVLVMIALATFGTATDLSLPGQVGLMLAKGAGFLGGLAVVLRFVLPRVLRVVARSAELLVLFSVAWAVALAAVSEALGFSSEVGAFVAGVALASTPYREAIGARLISLRDFLLLFFFVELGAQLAFEQSSGQLGPALVLSAFVLIGNPIIVLVIMGAMGYRKRTSFLAGLTVAQISEFSLILIALGLSLGHIGPETLGLVTVVGLVTIGLSTYMILYSEPIYRRLAGVLSVFERQQPRDLDLGPAPEPVEVVLYGLGRYGSEVASELEDAGVRLLVVESDPQLVAGQRTLQNGRSMAGPVVYGDAEDLEFVHNLPLGDARWVVGTMPSLPVNLTLLTALRHAGFAGQVALTAHNDADAQALGDAGADVMLRPFTDAADHVLDILGHPHAALHPPEDPD